MVDPTTILGLWSGNRCDLFISSCGYRSASRRKLYWPVIRAKGDFGPTGSTFYTSTASPRRVRLRMLLVPLKISWITKRSCTGGLSEMGARHIASGDQNVSGTASILVPDTNGTRLVLILFVQPTSGSSSWFL